MITGFILLIVLNQLLSVKKGKKKSLISSAVTSVLFYVGYIYTVNELLSLFDLITNISILLSWIVFDLALAVWCIALVRGNKKETKEWLDRKRCLIKKNRVSVTIMALLSVIVVYIALKTVPNNWDSLSYHLPRIIFWLKQGSVKHFATNDTRMLGSPPLKEFVDLHVYALMSNNDSLLNLTQAFSYLINVGFVALLAKEVGISKKGRIAAAALYAATPIAVAEAFTTQNDQFATVFVLIFAILCARMFKRIDVIGINKKTTLSLIAVGVCAAFTYLAKPSGMFMLVAFGLGLFVLAILKRKKIPILLFCCACVVTSAGVVVLPEMARNIQTYGSVVDPWQGPGQIASTLDPRLLAVNVLKNIGTNITYSLSPRAMALWERVVGKIASILSVDKNDPRIAERGMPYALQVDQASEYGYDTASSPLQSAIIIGMAVVGVVVSVSKKKRITCFELCAYLGFFLMLSFIKWELFMARYMVCGFAVAIPAAGNDGKAIY